MEPAPWLPTCSTRLHICSSKGLAMAKSSALPPTNPINLPSFAGPMLPPTGHSSNISRQLLRPSLPSRLVYLGEMVLHTGWVSFAGGRRRRKSMRREVHVSRVLARWLTSKARCPIVESSLLLCAHHVAPQGQSPSLCFGLGSVPYQHVMANNFNALQSQCPFFRFQRYQFS
jgi:hypothetical protein